MSRRREPEVLPVTGKPRGGLLTVTERAERDPHYAAQVKATAERMTREHQAAQDRERQRVADMRATKRRGAEIGFTVLDILEGRA
ncbi:hypothetical protein AB4Y42_06070 [Paraburkholderia sp. EG286B]|uniref:hypothetical protein n=1 Tax=Paraburkholderia sp. EG286B TaxID=3237011 RepID=UPI0034D2691B